jgi:hypothetical protein
MKPKLVISPRINESGRHEAESLVTPHKLSGGKRKGRSMKRPVRTKRPTETALLVESMKTAREHGGVYVPKLKMVVYYRD